MDDTVPATEVGRAGGYGWTPQFYGGPSELEGLSEEELDQRIEAYVQRNGHKRFLCDVCKAIFKNFDLEKQPQGDWSPLTEIKQNLIELQVSAKNGCLFCFFRQQQIEHSLEGWDNLSMSENLQYSQRGDIAGLDEGTEWDYWSLDIRLPRLTSRRIFYEMVYLEPLYHSKRSRHFSLLRQMGTGCSGLGSSNLNAVRTSNNSYASVSLTQTWIKDCMENHTRCHSFVPQNKVLPTRLIDLGSTAQISPKVCLGESLATDTLYVSLSHCWGGKRFLTLLQDNESRFQEHIPTDTLPQTFKDAMEFTKRLGIRYIWIDSLCIIQDSDEDWLHESGRMSNVYRFAVVNIAATKAHDGEEGCFTERSLMEVEPCQVDCFTASYYCQYVTMSSLLGDSPLMKRAWAVQEMALAPRVIHFADTQIYWECLELHASETFPDSTLGNSGLGLNIAMEALKKEQDWENPSMDRVLHWKRLVERYSHGALTFATKDKLVAISGLAREIGSPSEYVVGLWKPDLVYGLTWQADRTAANKNREVRPPEYRAPSWSWASVDGEVRFQYPNSASLGTIIVTFLEIYIKPLGDDPYGQIKHAFLRVKASLVICRTLNFDEDEYFPTGRLDGTSWCLPFMDDRKSNDEGIMKYCCPLYLEKETKEDIKTKEKKEVTTVHGLFLQPTGIKGQYTRCGYFEIRRLENELRRFDELCRVSPVDTPPEFYEEVAEATVEGHTQYVFTII